MTAQGVPADRQPDDLDVYDVAFLAGGPDRVVETAVVALVRARGIRLHSPGQLAPCGGTCRHPAEAAVLDALGSMGHRCLDAVRWRVVEDERVRAIGVRLHSAGLLGHVGAAVGALHGDRRWLAPTRAGRAALRALADGPALADPEVLAVALGGFGRMRDRALQTALFDESPAALPPPGRRFREDDREPQPTAYRTGGLAAAAGGFGLIEGGRFDGGF
jgi:hypothetical protein